MIDDGSTNMRPVSPVESFIRKLQAKNYLPRNLSVKMILGIAAVVVLVTGGASALVITQTGSLDIRQWAKVADLGQPGQCGGAKSDGSRCAGTQKVTADGSGCATPSCDCGYTGGSCQVGEGGRCWNTGQCNNADLECRGGTCQRKPSATPAVGCPTQDGWQQSAPQCNSITQRNATIQISGIFCHRCESKPQITPGQRCGDGGGCWCNEGFQPIAVAAGAICPQPNGGASIACYPRTDCSIAKTFTTTATQKICADFDAFNTQAECGVGRGGQVNCYDLEAGCAVKTIVGEDSCDGVQYFQNPTICQEARATVKEQVDCWIYQPIPDECRQRTYDNASSCEEASDNIDVPLFDDIGSCRAAQTYCYEFSNDTRECSRINTKRINLQGAIGCYGLASRGYYPTEEACFESQTFCYRFNDINNSCSRVLLSDIEPSSESCEEVQDLNVFSTEEECQPVLCYSGRRSENRNAACTAVLSVPASLCESRENHYLDEDECLQENWRNQTCYRATYSNGTCTEVKAAVPELPCSRLKTGDHQDYFPTRLECAEAISLKSIANQQLPDLRWCSYISGNTAICARRSREACFANESASLHQDQAGCQQRRDTTLSNQVAAATTNQPTTPASTAPTTTTTQTQTGNVPVGGSCADTSNCGPSRWGIAICSGGQCLVPYAVTQTCSDTRSDSNNGIFVCECKYSDAANASSSWCPSKKDCCSIDMSGLSARDQAEYRTFCGSSVTNDSQFCIDYNYGRVPSPEPSSQANEGGVWCSYMFNGVATCSGTSRANCLTFTSAAVHENDYESCAQRRDGFLTLQQQQTESTQPPASRGGLFGFVYDFFEDVRDTVQETARDAVTLVQETTQNTQQGEQNLLITSENPQTDTSGLVVTSTATLNIVLDEYNRGGEPCRARGQSYYYEHGVCSPYSLVPEGYVVCRNGDWQELYGATCRMETVVVERSATYLYDQYGTEIDSTTALCGQTSMANAINILAGDNVVTRDQSINNLYVGYNSVDGTSVEQAEAALDRAVANGYVDGYIEGLDLPDQSDGYTLEIVQDDITNYASNENQVVMALVTTETGVPHWLVITDGSGTCVDPYYNEYGLPTLGGPSVHNCFERDLTYYGYVVIYTNE